MTSYGSLASTFTSTRSRSHARSTDTFPSTETSVLLPPTNERISMYTTPAPAPSPASTAPTPTSTHTTRSDRTGDRPPENNREDGDDDGDADGTAAERKNLNGVQLRLCNSGSVARDHLAAERTYLAYVRTSLGMAGAGVALMQFLRLGPHTKEFAVPIGACTLVAGLLVLAFGTRRFFTIQRALVRGFFPPAVLEIACTSVGLAALVVVAFGVVMGGRARE